MNMQRWASLGLTLACLGLIHAQAGVLGTTAPVRSQAPSVATSSNPRSLYVLHCAGCHGMDGSGSELGQVPDMRRLGRFLMHPEGRLFLIQVPGVMGSGLNDVDVARVTNWVFDNLVIDVNLRTFLPYTPEEVSQARANPLKDVMRTRTRILTVMPSMH